MVFKRVDSAMDEDNKSTKMLERRRKGLKAWFRGPCTFKQELIIEGKFSLIPLPYYSAYIYSQTRITKL